MSSFKRSRGFDDDEDMGYVRGRGGRGRRGRGSYREPEASYTPPLEIPAARPTPVPQIDGASFEFGTVRFFNADKGFGFVTPDKAGADVFVHITAVRRSGLETLSEGQKIRFEREPSNRQTGKFSVRRLSA